MTKQVYPRRSGSKVDGASKRAANRIDSEPSKVYQTFVQVVMETITDPAVINIIAERIHKNPDYVSPLASRLVGMGVLKLGRYGKNPDTGRTAHVYAEAPDLLAEIERYLPQNEEDLLGVVKAFVFNRWLIEKQERQIEKAARKEARKQDRLRTGMLCLLQGEERSR